VRGCAIKILFLTQLCPYPPSSGGAIKTYNFLKHLGARHDVSLLTFVRSGDEVQFLSHLAPYCRGIDFCVIGRSRLLNMRYALKSLLAGRSFIITRDWHPDMYAKVRNLLDNQPDLIYVDHLQMFQFVPDPPPCPVVLDDHNIEWRIIERFASAGAAPFRRLFASLEWRKLRSYELDACRRAGLVFTVTPQDKSVLVSSGIPEQKIVSLPVGVDVDSFTPVRSTADDRKVLTFGTMSWPPNVDAVTYFVRAIYPLVKRQVSDVRFTVIGANPPREIRALEDQDRSINIAGFVEDIQAAAQGAAAFVAPLRIGSGIRVKILDAMAMGLPVVTTSVGCEGILLQPGEHALVTDAPGEFADAVVHLLLDPRERLCLGSAGRKLVESLYSWPPILHRLDQALSMFPANRESRYKAPQVPSSGSLNPGT